MFLFTCVGFHVKVPWELKVVVELDSTLPVVVVIESLELYHQNGRQLLHTQPLRSVNLLVATLAVISVRPIQKLACNITKKVSLPFGQDNGHVSDSPKLVELPVY